MGSPEYTTTGGTRRDENREKELFRENLFKQWTAGLTPLEQRISIFSHIRDIPYAIVPEWQGTEDLERMIITENRGWCGPKHHLLSWMLQRMGIEVRLVIIPFRWKDQPVRYPDTLMALVSSLPDTSHLCCKALLNDKWRLLDATWDTPLKCAGFPVNNPWDGESDTIPAVTTINPAEKRLIIQPSPAGRKQRIEFVIILNHWMDDIRTRKNEKFDR